MLIRKLKATENKINLIPYIIVTTLFYDYLEIKNDRYTYYYCNIQY